MEMDHGTCNTSTVAHDDIIGTMPDNVISNILNRVPLHRGVVRSSILSRNWRLKWTLITQVVLDAIFFDSVTRNEGKFVFDSRSISRILLHLKGDVTKFVIEITRKMSERFTVDDINHWVLFLSRKGIQEFSLRNMNDNIPVSLPTHIFSCVELKHLNLNGCCFPFTSGFTGFPNLLNLDLYNVTCKNREGWEFITRCPLLEILNFRPTTYHVHIDQVGPIDIAKLRNLKMLSLSVCILPCVTCSSIFQLIDVFPKLEELNLVFCECKFLEEKNACKRFSTVLPCLKTLTLHNVDFACGIATSGVFQLIFGSPNLQTVKIMANYKDDSPSSTLVFSEADFAAMGHLQLQKVIFKVIRDSENEVCLIKSLLACSPVLKKMMIYGFSSEHSNENGKLAFALKLLTLHRASPVAEIHL